jgi:hypothetical protein
VTNLRWISTTVLTWDPMPAAATYHVYRDAILSLGFDAFGTCRDDLDDERSDTSLSDASVPSPGAGFHYLITAEDSSGHEGTLGFASCLERSNFTPCP